MTAFLGFRAGGFHAGITGIAALVLSLGLVIRVTAARNPFAGWSAGLAVCAGAVALLGAWVLASVLWSHAPARALVEFDRVLLYLLVLVLCGLAPTRVGDLGGLLRAVAAVFSVVCLAGMLSRLAPDAVPTAANIIDERLSFPLTYWNAMGIASTLALVLCLHLSASGAEARWVRVLAAVLVTPAAVTLYLTFSRGAIWVAPVGVVVYLVLAQPRGLPTALLAAGLPAAFAVNAAYGADAIAQSDFATSALAADQGREVLIVVVTCMAAAAALRAIGLLVDARVERIALSPARLRAARWGVVAVTFAALAVGAVAADAPGRFEEIRSTFSRGSFLYTSDLRDRLLSVSDNGRVLHWRVAANSFRSEPVLGTGAGTFELTWEHRRPPPNFAVHDAHSLYLEVASELGVPGLVLLAVALGSVLVGALRRLGGPERHAHAAVVAAGAVLLLHAGVDWDWEMPALFVWFFGAGGVILAARAGGDAPTPPGRLPRLIAGLCCLLLALTPWLLAASQPPLDRAVEAFQRRDCPTAVDAALTAAERLSVRPEPFEVLGWCNLLTGQSQLALGAMEAARDRDPDNWAYAYGLAVARGYAGQDPRALAAEASRLNPLEPLARNYARRTAATESPARWRELARRAGIPR